ncbi:MAG: sigma-54-dependent Fis family transcriptional regulator, partial [bacterium]
MNRNQILIIDDEKNIRRSMELILTGEGFQVISAENASEGLTLLHKNLPDAVFLDVLLPDKNGLEILHEIKTTHPEVAVIMISGHANLSMAVEAIKAGAYDFLEKPLQKEKILITLHHLFENQKLKDRYRNLQKEVAEEHKILGNSSVITNLKEQLQKVASTDSKVLILGESGTGKELAAWAIHDWSDRRLQPFIKMNCAAIPEELTESELFGYEKGAFTGARDTRDGKFSLADNGTLFLDEIADMSLRVQTKVLRVLQDGRFEKVGGKDTIQVDVRVIAATNKNLEDLVSKGQFREDLFYRLNVLPLHIPPLRERREDIPILIEYFISKFCRKNNRKPVSLQKTAIKKLQLYSWPGNIRELQNLVERLVIMASDNKITEADIPHSILHSQTPPTPDESGAMTLKTFREKAEREYIKNTLENCKGNVTEAARILGIER